MSRRCSKQPRRSHTSLILTRLRSRDAEKSAAHTDPAQPDPSPHLSERRGYRNRSGLSRGRRGPWAATAAAATAAAAPSQTRSAERCPGPHPLAPPPGPPPDLRPGAPASDTERGGGGWEGSEMGAGRHCGCVNW